MEKVNVFDFTLGNGLGNIKEELPPLRLSRFVHEFRKDGIVALYHSLIHRVIYLREDIYREYKGKIEERKILTEEQHANTRELIKQGFLVSLGYEESRILQEIRDRFLGKPAFGILYLLLTDFCNLRCRYCYIERAIPANHTFSFMSEEIAIKGLNFFAKTLAKNPPDRKIERPTIIFYGGEPLLNRRAFLTSVNEIARLKKISELPSMISVSLITNATVLDEEIVAAIVENEVAVSVSLDGPKDLHDANRILASGAGTFERVVKNIRWLQEVGANVSISCTISNANLDQLEDVLKWLISEFHIKGVGFNMLLDLPGVIQADEEYAKKASEKIISCYQIARERGVYEERIMRKIGTFVRKSLHLVDCGGCGNQIVVTPDGRIGPCHAYASSNRFFPACLDDQDFNPFQDSVFIEWSQRSPFNISQCQFCEAIGLCGGGCPYNAELKRGSIWEIDPNFCLHTKKTLEWIIWDLYEKIKERR